MARRVASPIFVGRERELDRLVSALADASSRNPSTVLIGGEAGIGKTRLVAELGSRAREAGARVLAGRCVPIGTLSPAYGPIVDAFLRLFAELDGRGIARLLGADRGALARLLPALAADAPTSRSLPDPDPDDLPPELLRVVRRLSSAAPLVFIAEDLHWADRATLDALSFLARSLRDERVLLLATYRTDALRDDHGLLAVLAEMDRGAGVEWLELARFDRPELDRLLAGILGHEPDPALAERVHTRSGGNPYFAEELLALGGAEASLPATLREVLLARIDGLAEPTRALLRVASVAGPRIDVHLVAQVDGMGAGARSVSLREAVAHQVLLPCVGSTNAYEFRHALLAEAVYEDLLPAERVRLHAALARCLDRHAGAGSDPAITAQLAHHWFAAGDRPRALAAAVRAGQSARSVRAHGDALAQLERALELWPQVPSAHGVAGLDLVALRELAAECAVDAGDPVRAVAHLQAAIALARPVADPVRIGLLFDRLGSASLKTGDAQASARAHAEAVRRVGTGAPVAARAQVLGGLARRLMLDGRWAACQVAAAESLELARLAGATGIEADVLATLGAAQGSLGAIDDALVALRLGVDLGLRVGAAEAATRAWSNLASLQEGEASVREALAAADWNERLGPGRPATTWVRCLGSIALFELGRWQEAAAQLDCVRGTQLEPTGERFLDICDAQLDLGRGAFESASARLDHARRPIEPAEGDRFTLIAEHLGIQLLLARGELEQARAHGDRALGQVRALPLGARVCHCEVFATALRIGADLAAAARRHGDRAAEAEARRRAATALDASRTLRTAVAGEREHHWRRPSAVNALCEAEWTRLAGASDAVAWAAAAEACTAAGQLFARPYALLRQAEALLVQARDRHAAAGVLQEAHRTAAAMGASPLVDQAEELAGRARIGLAPPLTPGPSRNRPTPARPRQPSADAGDPGDPLAPYRLTRRERQVLALVAAGRTNRQIAEALFIGERTAGIHVSSILAKLDLHRRAEAAALVHRLGAMGHETGSAAVVRGRPG